MLVISMCQYYDFIAAHTKIDENHPLYIGENIHGPEDIPNPNGKFHVSYFDAGTTRLIKHALAYNYLLASNNHTYLINDVAIVVYSLSVNDENESKIVLDMLLGREPNGIKLLSEDGKLYEAQNTTSDARVCVNFLRNEGDGYTVEYVIRDTFACIIQKLMKMCNEMRIAGFNGSLGINEMMNRTLHLPDNMRPDYIDYPIVVISHFLSRHSHYLKAFVDSLSHVIVNESVKRESRNKVDGCQVVILRAALNSFSDAERIAIPFGLDEEIKIPSYVLGRFMAEIDFYCGEKLEAGDFKAISKNPRSEFPKVLRRIADEFPLERIEYYMNALAVKKIAALDEVLPAMLHRIEQGLFAIGYYHQMYALVGTSQDEIKEKEAHSE